MSAQAVMTEERTARGRSLVEGEFVFTAEDSPRHRRHASRRRRHPPCRKPRRPWSSSCSAKRLRALGLESFRDYCALISGVEGLDERQRMLTALTTNVTRFFREPHHFEHLRTKVLPDLIERARRGERVRLWSASLLLRRGALLHGHARARAPAPDVVDLDFRILATDIDREMISRGRQGVYAEGLVSAIPGGTPSQMVDSSRLRDRAATRPGALSKRRDA